MKLILKCFYVALVLMTPQQVCSEDLSLAGAYQKALVRSEALQIDEQEIALAQARYREAYSAIFPEINLNIGQQLRNTASSSGSGSNDGLGSSGGIPSGSRHRFRSALTVSQPIFKGFRDFLLADAAKSEERSSELQRDRKREQLYLEVASLYLQIYLDSLDLKLLARTSEVLDERLAELQEWMKLGKSKQSEVSAAHAEKSDLVATVAQVRGSDRAARELMAYLVGEDVSSARFSPPPAVPEKISLATALEQGKQRLDIRALSEQVNSAQQQMLAARRERWPAITLDGNYYPYQDPSSKQDWDVFLSLNLPIFDGGRITARIAQQQALLRQRELTLQQLQRLTERDIRSAYQELLSSQERIKSLSTLVSDAERSYQAQRGDYKLGIVTNLDVLQAIRQLEDARRRLLSAQIEAQLNFTKLTIASGGPLT